MYRIQKLFVFIIFCFFSYGVFSQSQGEKLFKENKPEMAAEVLENEILNGIISGNTYNFLGLSYYQIGKYEKSVEAFARGIENQHSNIKILAFNQGNSYYALKDFNKAIGAFTKSLEDDNTFYPALLNRANSFLMAGQYGKAREDYINFLEKCPEDSQKNTLEDLIKALEDEMERLEEEARLKALAQEPVWEPVEDSLANIINKEKLPEMNSQWEKIEDFVMKEENNVEKKSQWEEINGGNLDNTNVSYEKSDKNTTDKIKNQNNEENNIKNNENSESWEKVKSDKLKDTENREISAPNIKITENNHEEQWEKIENSIGDDFENIDDSWNLVTEEKQVENVDAADIEEMKRFEEDSLREWEQWLTEQRKLQERDEYEKLLEEKMKLSENERFKEQIIKEMMAAEDARRQKLIDDVANSLQQNDSTNMSSGSDNIIDYEFEGELD